MSRRLAAPMAALVGALCTTCSEERVSDSDQQTRVVQCAALGMQVKAFPADSFANNDPCALVARALEGLRLAAQRGEVDSADTIRIREAGIGPMRRVGSGGEPLGPPTWLVQFSLDDRTYDLQAIIDRDTDDVRVEPTHKPL